MKRILLIPVSAAVVLTAANSQAGWPGDTAACKPDMVKVGASCIDRYEASVWSVPDPTTTNKKLVSKIIHGKATLAELTAAGAVQLGCTSPLFGHTAYPASFPGDGNWTPLVGSTPPTPGIYAASIPGVLPSTCTTWFQAEQACGLSNKRLARNQDWQRAAAGTRDPGANDGLANTKCNTLAAAPRNTGLAGSAPGDAATCVSNWGAEDMVGNVWEWVGDWSDFAIGCASWTTATGIAGDDLSCFGGDGNNFTVNVPAPMVRGGQWVNGTDAGVFAVGTAQTAGLSLDAVGFRCSR